MNEGTYVRDGKFFCMNCLVKESHGYFSMEFDHCGFFCSKECRDIWNKNHPHEDIFKPIIRKKYSQKKYCSKCNYEMKQFYNVKDGSYWECPNKC